MSFTCLFASAIIIRKCFGNLDEEKNTSSSGVKEVKSFKDFESWTGESKDIVRSFQQRSRKERQVPGAVTEPGAYCRQGFPDHVRKLVLKAV